MSCPACWRSSGFRRPGFLAMCRMISSLRAGMTSTNWGFMTSDLAERCGPATIIVRLPHIRNTRVEYRPVTQPPPDNTVSIIYRRKDDTLRLCGVGLFKDGEWTNGKTRKALDTEGLYWTALVDEH